MAKKQKYSHFTSMLTGFDFELLNLFLASQTYSPFSEVDIERNFNSALVCLGIFLPFTNQVKVGVGFPLAEHVRVTDWPSLIIP